MPLPAAAICGVLVAPAIGSPVSDDARTGAANVAPPSLEIDAKICVPCRRSSHAIATTSSAVPAVRASTARSAVGAVVVLGAAAAKMSRVELARCSRHAHTMPPLDVMPTCGRPANRVDGLPTLILVSALNVLQPLLE